MANMHRGATPRKTDLDHSEPNNRPALSGEAPLSIEEERDSARRFQREGDLAAGNRIVRSQYRFVSQAARQYPSVDYDDAFQAGLCGLAVALHRFDADRGVRLISYAAQFIHGEISRLAKRGGHSAAGSQSPTACLDAQVGCDDDGRDPLIGFISDDSPTPEDIIVGENELATRRQALQSVLDALPARDRRVFEARNIHDVPLSRLARELGISAERVRQIHDRVFVYVEQRAPLALDALAAERRHRKAEAVPAGRKLGQSASRYAGRDHYRLFIDRGLSPETARAAAKLRHPVIDAFFGVPGADDKLWRKPPARIWLMGSLAARREAPANQLAPECEERDGKVHQIPFARRPWTATRQKLRAAA